MNSVILTIDTSTSCCSAALCSKDQVVDSRFGDGVANHTQLLPRFINELMTTIKNHNLTIDGVAVSAGPGSYTGLRIGVSTAKGLAYGLSVPLVAIPTLEVLSSSFLNTNNVEADAVLCPMIDARRMEIYTALYNVHLAEKTKVEARVVNDNEWLKNKGIVYFFGDGAAKCKDILQTDTIHFIDNIKPDARFMGQQAYLRLANGNTEDIAYFEPFYLKDFVPAPSHIKGLQ